MNRFDEQFIKNLRKIKKAGKLNQFRVSFRNIKTVSAGATQKEFMGKYHPLKYRTNLSGSYLFQWPNGKLSKGNITRDSLHNFDQFIKEAQATAFEDKFGDNFPKEKKHPQIKTGFEGVTKTIETPAPYLTGWLKKLTQWQNQANPKGTKYITAGLSVSQYRLVSSAGFDLTNHATLNRLFSYYDGKTYLQHKSRDLLDAKRTAAKRAETETVLKRLQNTVKKKPERGQWPVIFHPNVFSDLFFSFLAPNLSGSIVMKGHSKFAIDQFKSQEQVLRKDISLICNPTQEGKLDSYNFTGEGILSRKTVFIKDGKLITPILSAKYARKAEMEPTTKINKPMDTTEIKSKNGSNFKNFIRKKEKTILIYKALGGHAQDTTTGSYSLPCPYAILIEDGKMVGNLPCVVTGNFFKNLNNPETVFLNYPTEHPPALATTANIVFTT